VSQRKYNFVPDEFYHLYNRGTDKRIIFKSEDDYDRFQLLLYISNSQENINTRNLLRNTDDLYSYESGQKLVSIKAYCLMPNHYHILATPIIENGLSLFMQKLSTSYAMYFNKKYDRTGTLFEGKFKSQHVGDDRYLKYLFSYIHLNPTKLVQSRWKELGIKNKSSVEKYLKQYKYSSLSDFCGKNRVEAVIVDKDISSLYFTNIDDLEGEVREWLSA